MKEYTECAREMLEFIDKSPTCFQTVKNIGDMLSAAGFAELREADEWKLEKGKGYFVTRNESSVIAFRLPEQLSGFHIAAAHSDSPSFKVKEGEHGRGALCAAEHGKVRRNDPFDMA